MSTPAASERIADVPTQVFEKFLQNLEEAGAPSELVEALRRVLFQEKKYSERVLKDAVLGTETEQ